MATERTRSPVMRDIRQAAEAVIARYPVVRASETASTIAMLMLWALDAVEAGRLSPDDADHVFTLLDVQLGDTKDGPELPDEVGDLILEGEHFHHWGDDLRPDAATVRALAFSILGASV